MFEVGEAVWRTIEELSPPDWSFVMTAAVGPGDEWFVDRLADLAEKRASTYTVVELRCDLDELKRRIESPDRSERLKMTSVSGIRELSERGTPPIDRPDVVRIDTTDLAPEVAAAMILSSIAATR